MGRFGISRVLLTAFVVATAVLPLLGQTDQKTSASVEAGTVHIVGGVRKPGSYPITETMTVTQLILRAGGLTDHARAEKITVLRFQNGKQMAFGFNYREVINSQKLAQNIELKAGDTVVVPVPSGAP